MMDILDWTRALLWPDRCVLCGRVTAYRELCCPLCRRDTPLEEEPVLREGIPVAAVWRYRGLVPAAVGRFKFHGDRRSGEQMARLMAGAWRELCPEVGVDCVTFVPIPPERQRQRGYNQAELLARWAAWELGLPVEPLLRREGVMMQHEVSANLRKKGIRHAFRLLPGAEEKAAGKHILLVDDVVTTGGTIRSCADQLLEAGAREVAALAIALVEE